MKNKEDFIDYVKNQFTKVNYNELANKSWLSEKIQNNALLKISDEKILVFPQKFLEGFMYEMCKRSGKFSEGEFFFIARPDYNSCWKNYVNYKIIELYKNTATCNLKKTCKIMQETYKGSLGISGKLILDMMEKCLKFTFYEEYMEVFFKKNIDTPNSDSLKLSSGLLKITLWKALQENRSRASNPDKCLEVLYDASKKLGLDKFKFVVPDSFKIDLNSSEDLEILNEIIDIRISKIIKKSYNIGDLNRFDAFNILKAVIDKSWDIINMKLYYSERELTEASSNPKAVVENQLKLAKSDNNTIEISHNLMNVLIYHNFFIVYKSQSSQNIPYNTVVDIFCDFIQSQDKSDNYVDKKMLDICWNCIISPYFDDDTKFIAPKLSNEVPIVDSSLIGSLSELSLAEV